MSQVFGTESHGLRVGGSIPGAATLSPGIVDAKRRPDLPNDDRSDRLFWELVCQLTLMP
jgi:hypothetical protein